VRIAVLVVGLVAAAVAGVGGFISQIAANETKERIAADEKSTKSAGRPWIMADRDAEELRIGRIMITLYYAGAGLGVFASFLAFTRRRFTAALMFLVAAVGPIAINLLLAVFTGLLGVPALLSVFIGAAPRPEPVG
jgi:hypothetical protein